MNNTKIAVRNCLLFVAIFFVGNCSETPIIVSKGEYRLNSPSSMVIIPGTDLAIVANANVNLDQVDGALIAVDLSTNKLLLDTLFTIPSFAGEMFLDTVRSRIYIPNHDKSLLVYEYSMPGTDGNPISFAEIEVPNPYNDDGDITLNGVETDDGPSQALMIPGTSLGDLILVANQKGSVSTIPASTLKLEDMDDDDKYFGLRLFSSFNFKNLDNFPGSGAARMGISPVTGLVYITSALNNHIYVLDPITQTIEAMINLDSISLPTVGMREILIDSHDVAYIAHSGLDSIVMLDVSGITKNGIPYEVIDSPVMDVIPVGDGPEDLELTADEATLFLSNQNEDSIYMIDTALRQVTKKTYLDIGKSPSRLVLDETRNTVYSLDFFSNTISLIDATTGEFVEDIE